MKVNLYIFTRKVCSENIDFFVKSDDKAISRTSEAFAINGRVVLVPSPLLQDFFVKKLAFYMHMIFKTCY